MADDRRGGEQAERQRRLAALRDLTQQPGQASASPAQDDTLKRRRVAAPNRPQRPPQRVATVARSLRSQPLHQSAAGRLAMAALVIVILAAGAWALHNRQPSGKAAPPPQALPVRSIDLGAYNFSCPMDPQWSPDGTQIALWAALGDCGNTVTGGSELAIFDARTGKLTNGITLHGLLVKQGLPTKLTPSPFAWSPDGASLSFCVGYLFASAANSPHGLFTITLAHDTARYIADSTPLRSALDNSTRIWDITSGKVIHITGDGSADWGAGALLAPGGAYVWGANGSLAPTVTGATGKGVVRVWQAGDIIPMNAMAGNENVQGPPDEYVPQDWVYSSNIPQWSPDHRYLALPVDLSVRLPGGPHAFPDAECTPQLCDSTPVAPPDKAFSAALAAAIKGWVAPQAATGQPPQWYSMDIAWRADGHELATMLPNEDFNLAQPVAKVSIFNTQTGALITKLSITRTVVNGANEGPLPQIAWSPHGASLAALDSGDATLTLWRAE